MKIIKPLILLLITSAAAFSSNAQKYDVEVIIFEDTQSRYINSESWNHSEEPVDGESNFDRLNLDKNNTAVYQNLKPGILGSEYKRIKNSAEYNVLLYSAWRQTGLEATKAFEIDISKLKNADKSTSQNTITGQLKVVLARYLHFYGQLNYQQNNINYPMAVQRRMRSKELHYIDHPLVGILVQINPVKQVVKQAIKTGDKPADKTSSQ